MFDDNSPQRKRSPTDLCGIAVEHEFHHNLRLERLRTDRSGQPFALLVFRLQPDRNGRRKTRAFIEALLKRIRAIDQIGWFGADQVGVLLAFSDHQGAQRFIQTLQNNGKGRRALPPCAVYPYSKDWQSRGSSGAEKDERLESGSQHRRLPEDLLDFVIAQRIPRWKRALDVAGSLIGLIVLSPLFLLMTLYVRLVSAGPILFKQPRVGYMGRSFTCLKFRTMRVGQDSATHRQYVQSLIHSDRSMTKLDNQQENRLIFGARAFRKLGLDELPQLVNVLRGEMSLVGPRPCLAYEAKEYSRWHARRFDILPGMTGLWQVSGKNKLSFQQMIRLDIAYAGHMSLWLDLKIILMTVPALALIFCEAVYARISAKFRRPDSRGELSGRELG